MFELQAALLTLALSGAGETVLLDFYSDSCGPCRQMDPVVRQLAAAGYPVRKVNCSHEPQLASRFGVSSIPCFVMLVEGREVDRVVGSTSMGRLEQMCKLGMRQAPGGTPATLVSNTSAPSVIPARQAGLDLSALSAPERSRAEPDLNQLLACTVRLRIEDRTGHSCGSGTIIDARDGEALILTCGHIFRDSQGKGRIEVDLFGASPAQRLAGRILHYDLESDVGLLTVRTPGPVAVARVAPPGRRLGKGDAVVNVGCNNGEPPTARRSHVTSVDRFSGPPNLEVAGLPVQGRSGGGLFSSDGEVVGVCFAADPADNQGLYAALPTIHGELDRMKLSFVYQSPSEGVPVASGPPPMDRRMPGSVEPPPLEVASRSTQPLGTAPDQLASVAGGREEMTARERATLEEIHRRKAEGAEVVCVIRSRLDPKAQSEIIFLEKASPAFLQQLEGAARPADSSRSTVSGPPREMALSDPTPPRPRTLLEYSAPANPSGPAVGRDW